MFPNNFSSKKEYDNYLSCRSNIKIGDIIVAETKFHGNIKGRVVGYNRYSDAYLLGINVSKGDEPNRSFHYPSLVEKNGYLVTAKKICPLLLISSIKIFWLPTEVGGTRILKVIKYNGEQEKKEKKEKAKAAKSLRSSGKHEVQCGTYETQINS
jgi:hypothetical protein